MSTLTLSRIEAKILTAAAGQTGAQVVLPAHLKPATAQRLTAKFLKHELVASRDPAGDGGCDLTAAGYRSVGLTPPVVPSADASVSKRDQVLDLLRRTEGASLSELIALTRWLPHTARAALSRLRSGGQPLAKSTREDGSTAYRIAAAEPEQRKLLRRPARRSPAEVRARNDVGASADATAA